MDTNALLEIFPILLVNFNQQMVLGSGCSAPGGCRCCSRLKTQKESTKFLQATPLRPSWSSSNSPVSRFSFWLRVCAGTEPGLSGGEYTSDEALAAMLEGSLLMYVTDDATGAVMVRRIEGNQSDDGNGPEDEPVVLNQSNNSNPNQETEMNVKNKKLVNNICRYTDHRNCWSTNPACCTRRGGGNF